MKHFAVKSHYLAHLSLLVFMNQIPLSSTHTLSLLNLRQMWLGLIIQPHVGRERQTQVEWDHIHRIDLGVKSLEKERTRVMNIGGKNKVK